jgi:hypothetical protein
MPVFRTFIATLINPHYHAVHLMSGSELGPLNGSDGFVGFFVPVCFFNLASAAAARSARILALSSSDKLES